MKLRSRQTLEDRHFLDSLREDGDNAILSVGSGRIEANSWSAILLSHRISRATGTRGAAGDLRTRHGSRKCRRSDPSRLMGNLSEGATCTSVAVATSGLVQSIPSSETNSDHHRQSAAIAGGELPRPSDCSSCAG